MSKKIIITSGISVAVVLALTLFWVLVEHPTVSLARIRDLWKLF